MIFAEIEGHPVAYSRVFWEDKLDGNRAYGAFGWLDPKHRGRGIGTAMYEANEAHLRDIAAGHPAEQPKHILTMAAEADSSGMRLVEKHGFEPDMYLADMVRPDLEDIPEAGLPEGIVHRTPRPDEYRKVWEAEVEALRVLVEQRRKGAFVSGVEMKTRVETMIARKRREHGLED